MPKRPEGRERERPRKMETKEIIRSFWERFPEIAKQLIEKHLDLRNPSNQRLFENPDDPKEHTPEWHQWGIITHTKMFEKYYREEMPRFLKEWGVEDDVRQVLEEKIDGMSKDELLNMSIPFHDLGKFTKRTLKTRKDGSVYPTYVRHEQASGEIIRWPAFSGMLRREYGLTGKQIEYIARCAELHYELAIVRDVAKRSDMGYSFAFARSEGFREKAKDLLSRFPGFELEIGLLYLADSLAKTDIRIMADDDAPIAPQEDDIRRTLSERGLDPKLISVVKQLPISRAVVEHYLKLWAKTVEH